MYIYIQEVIQELVYVLAHKRLLCSLCLYVYVYVYMCVYVYVYMYVYVHVYMCVYVYVYMCVNVYVYICQGVIEELVYLLAHKKLLPLPKLEKAEKKKRNVSALIYYIEPL
jgi:hypothetical protein